MSLMTREDVLRELELLPVWQLKVQLPTIQDVAVPNSVVEVPTEPVLPSTSVPPVVSIPPAISTPTVIAPPVVVTAAIEASVTTTVPLAPDEMDSSVAETIPPESLPLADEHMEIPAVIVTATTFRLLVSEDTSLAFVLDAAVLNDRDQDAETLLNNMLRAINIKCNIDISDANTDRLAEHSVQAIIVMGESLANSLMGKKRTIEEWRSLQSDTLPNYLGLPVVATYHPLFLLKNTAYKANAWLDLCTAKATLKQTAKLAAS